MSEIDVPTFDALMNPLLRALKELGGSGTIEELNNKVIEIAGLSDEQTEVLHKPEKGGGRTEVEYRLGWTRTYLKKYGLIDNSSRGVWALTPAGRKVDRVNPRQVRRFVQQQSRRESEETEEVELDEEESWRDELLEALLEMDPPAFERLVQRLLRESGFIKVEVTGRSGDGGVDGKGVMRLGGLLSFHVIFQCKRYRGSVSVSQVRDFRGAMVGRADKGLTLPRFHRQRDKQRSLCW
jgi:restriction system protein